MKWLPQYVAAAKEVCTSANVPQHPVLLKGAAPAIVGSDAYTRLSATQKADQLVKTDGVHTRRSDGIVLVLDDERKAATRIAASKPVHQSNG